MAGGKKLKAVVLAAGKGTRLQSLGGGLPKVLLPALRKPLLGYVLDALDFILPEDTVIVVGHQKEKVMAAFPGYVFAEQREQLGTGHAVLAAYEKLRGFGGMLLVCCGDMPLLKRETYRALCAEHERAGAACTVLTGTADLGLPYGRILRDENGDFLAIVEEKDCTEEQKRLTELNSGVYVFDAAALGEALGALRRDNAQGEYYLTDAPALMRARGLPVGACGRELGPEILGVNTPEQLREVERLLGEQV